MVVSHRALSNAGEVEQVAELLAADTDVRARTDETQRRARLAEVPEIVAEEVFWARR